MPGRKRVDIAGTKWRVEVAPKTLRGKWGHCDHHQKLIELCPTTAQHGMDREIFIHEFTHGECWFLDEECVKEFAKAADECLDEPIYASRHRRLSVLLSKHMPFLTAKCRLQFVNDLDTALDIMEL